MPVIETPSSPVATPAESGAAPKSCCAHAAATAPVAPPPVVEKSCCAHMASAAPAPVAEVTPLAGGQASCCHPADVAAPGAVAAAPAHLWRTAAANTLVCLLGCSIGDVGVVVASRVGAWPLSLTTLMVMAIAAGLVTSIALETVWLVTGSRMAWGDAFRRAAGMSLISMVAMEIAMNVVDLGVSGGMRMALPWSQYFGVLALGEIAGFLVPLPYNWWRLRYFGKACH
jgi:hypothetical protein